MPRKYSDYFQETILTIPESFINVKTGETEAITSKIQDQIAYHSKNNTLSHFIFSALHDYLHHSKTVQGNVASDHAILEELSSLKRLLLQNGYDSSKSSNECTIVSRKEQDPTTVGLKEIDDLLEAFGG
ncbi:MULTISPECIES: hypothetical protein [Bacillaceae]|uniref:hypothetical protein n=1 Tax=Bacillaceae TaxID=186817 RepID=UPI001C55B748|nr:hypothetical protein [Rossellomorea sp. YZS02]MBW3113770.1 hypothetical protein [Bacillus sp. MCCB 382]MDX8343987.1 hypothetical protein [Rossellomorea sp. YZS02]